MVLPVAPAAPRVSPQPPPALPARSRSGSRLPFPFPPRWEPPCPPGPPGPAPLPWAAPRTPLLPAQQRGGPDPALSAAAPGADPRAAHLAEAAAVVLAAEESGQPGREPRRRQRLQLLTEPLRLLVALVFRHGGPAAPRVPSAPAPPRRAGRSAPAAPPSVRPRPHRAALPLVRPPCPSTRNSPPAPPLPGRALRLVKKSRRYFGPAFVLAALPVCHAPLRHRLPDPPSASRRRPRSDWPVHASISALTPVPILNWA